MLVEAKIKIGTKLTFWQIFKLVVMKVDENFQLVYRTTKSSSCQDFLTTEHLGTQETLRI